MIKDYDDERFFRRRMDWCCGSRFAAQIDRTGRRLETQVTYYLREIHPGMRVRTTMCHFGRPGCVLQVLINTAQVVALAYTDRHPWPRPRPDAPDPIVSYVTLYGLGGHFLATLAGR